MVEIGTGSIESLLYRYYRPANVVVYRIDNNNLLLAAAFEKKKKFSRQREAGVKSAFNDTVFLAKCTLFSTRMRRDRL